MREVSTRSPVAVAAVLVASALGFMLLTVPLMKLLGNGPGAMTAVFYGMVASLYLFVVTIDLYLGWRLLTGRIHAFPDLESMFVLRRLELKDVPGIRSAYRAARSFYHRKNRWLAWPLVRQLRCLQLRRVTVLYPARARGTAVVRYYWHRFLERHRHDIRGSVLEIGSTSTVRAFGGSQIQQAKAIDIAPTSSEVTIVADLAQADHIDPDQFDCFVNQFTMHMIDDFKAALYHSIRLLKPAGVLLINFPARSGYQLDEFDPGSIYHWFTPAGVEKAIADLGLTKDDYELTTYGNFFSLTAYMAGIPAEELTSRELDYEEEDIPLLICARVVKPLHWSAQ